MEAQNVWIELLTTDACRAVYEAIRLRVAEVPVNVVMSWMKLSKET